MAIDSFFKDIIQSPGAQGALGGAASGAVVSLLMNKKARKKLGETAMTIGGTAAVAGLGYYAYKKWQERQNGGVSAPPQGGHPPVTSTPPHLPMQEGGSPSPATVRQSTLSAPPTVNQGLHVKIILAMIAASAADGHIDHDEMNHLFQSMNSGELTPEEKSHLTATLNNPPTAEDIAALSDSTETAAELYAASLAAIDLDSPAEDFYLRSLANAQNLDEGLVAHLHEEAKNF